MRLTFPVCGWSAVSFPRVPAVCKQAEAPWPQYPRYRSCWGRERARGQRICSSDDENGRLSGGEPASSHSRALSVPTCSLHLRFQNRTQGLVCGSTVNQSRALGYTSTMSTTPRSFTQQAARPRLGLAGVRATLVALHLSPSGLFPVPAPRLLTAHAALATSSAPRATLALRIYLEK
eukprot:COSAG02_NODE_2661_length_8306_cov_942.235287_11_plen_177_part_00